MNKHLNTFTNINIFYIMITNENNNSLRGLSGLANLGNTCYINSCMAVLSHTYELNNILDNENILKKIKKSSIDGNLLMEWVQLKKLLWADNCTVSPNRFIRILQIIALKKDMHTFSGFAQNDLSEFLIFIISCFHNALSRKTQISINGKPKNSTDKIALKCYEMIKNLYQNDYSEIFNKFYGIHVSLLNSIETGRQLTFNAEPYFIINLPIPTYKKEPTIYECFDLYVEGESLTGENAWYNEDSKEHVDVKKQIKFWSFPDILVIDLKRFNDNNRKNQKIVHFPLTNLDLTSYVIGYNKNKYKYNLFGVCNHTGNLLGGHYTSFVKHYNEKWYHFNDTNVNEVKDESKIVSPKAYCLFYRLSI